MVRRPVKLFFKYVLLTLIFFLMVFPLVWMFRVALMPVGESVAIDTMFNSPITLDSFRVLLTQTSSLKYFFNSVAVAMIVVTGNILFCFTTAYGLARFKSIINKPLFVTVLVVLMIPSHILIIPLYLLALKAKVYDTFLALILPWLVSPIGIFLVKQYIENIPTSMEEAARIDGAGEFRILFEVVMPMCKPALAVLAIQVFFTNWNSFLFPYILTSKDSLKTLPVGLAQLQGHQAIDWQQLMAGSTLAVLPVLIIFLIMQRQIVSGVTAGAIKQ